MIIEDKILITSVGKGADWKVLATVHDVNVHLKKKPFELGTFLYMYVISRFF